MHMIIYMLSIYKRFEWWTFLVQSNVEFGGANPFLDEYMSYLPSNVKCLHIFKDKKPRLLHEKI
jgi:hypothetical protein